MPFLSALPPPEQNHLPNLGTPPPIISVSGKVNATIGYTASLTTPDGKIFRYRNKEAVGQSLLYAYETLSGTLLTTDERVLLENIWARYAATGGDHMNLTEIIRFLSRHENPRLGQIIGVIQNNISTNPQNLYLLLSENVSREAGRFRGFLTDIIAKIPPKELSRILLLIGSLENTQDVGTLLASLPAEQRVQIAEIMKDPRSRRIFLQDTVLRMTDLIYRETGVRIDAVSFGGARHGDGGMIVSIPGKSGKPTFLIITKHHTTVAETATEALDTLSMVNKSPVFTHYLIDASGKILGQIETPLSIWTREQIFPTAELMEQWTRNPSLIPTGVSLDISLFNHRNKVTLTQKTKNGWFTQLGISEGNIWNIRAATSFATIGWQYRSQENTLTLHTSASNTRFSSHGFRDTEAFNIGANWHNSLVKVGDITISSSGNASISAQATGGNWRNPQTGEGTISNSLHASSQISPHTQIKASLGSKYNWAPKDVTPNTFYKIHLRERGLGRVLTSQEYGLQVVHILENGGKIEGNAHYEVGPLARKIRGQVSYALTDEKTRFIIYGEKLRGPYNANNIYYGIGLQHRF